MVTEDSDLRRRTAAKEEKQYGKSTSGISGNKDEKDTEEKTAASSSFNWVDGLRVLTALALVSFVASYFLTRGESFIWNARRPWWTMPKMIKAAFVRFVLYQKSESVCF